MTMSVSSQLSLDFKGKAFGICPKGELIEGPKLWTRL